MAKFVCSRLRIVLVESKVSKYTPPTTSAKISTAKSFHWRLMIKYKNVTGKKIAGVDLWTIVKNNDGQKAKDDFLAISHQAMNRKKPTKYYDKENKKKL